MKSTERQQQPKKKKTTNVDQTFGKINQAV